MTYYEKSKKKVTLRYSICFPNKYGNCRGQPCSQITDEEPYQRFSETGTYIWDLVLLILLVINIVVIV